LAAVLLQEVESYVTDDDEEPIGVLMKVVLNDLYGLERSLSEGSDETAYRLSIHVSQQIAEGLFDVSLLFGLGGALAALRMLTSTLEAEQISDGLMLAGSLFRHLTETDLSGVGWAGDVLLAAAAVYVLLTIAQATSAADTPPILAHSLLTPSLRAASDVGPVRLVESFATDSARLSEVIGSVEDLVGRLRSFRLRQGHRSRVVRSGLPFCRRSGCPREVTATPAPLA